MENAGGEEVLDGGVDQAGAVVRVGATVRRPGGRNAPAVRLLLAHLARTGFAGAPRFHGLDARGREILDYLPGDVAIPPFPDWAADEELLVSVARLQRALHTAAAGFTLPPGVAWSLPPLPDGAAGTLVCHADLCLENVVVRDGRAAAFIDFDLAMPVDRLFDIAVAVRHWIPMYPAEDVHDARRHADPGRRFRLFCDAHGLTAAERDRVLDLLQGYLVTALDGMRAKAEAGHPAYARIWRDGYPALNSRSRAWLRAHRAALAAAGPGA